MPKEVGIIFVIMFSRVEVQLGGKGVGGMWIS